jgi:hypothetical protein
MRFLVATCLAAALAICGFAAPASAQYLPGGSWQQSCQDGIVRGNRLEAQCQGNGGWRWSSVSLAGCRSFGNNNGQLFCESRGGWHPGGGWAGHVPGGSYLASCQGAYMRGTVLTASCSYGRGYNTSSIDTRSCPSRQFGNANGNLFCER